METLTREEIEMCEMAVAIVTDTRDLTDDNKAKWDALFNKLERMQKVESRPTPSALDGAKCACPYPQISTLVNPGFCVICKLPRR